jgi:hypothetical protein
MSRRRFTEREVLESLIRQGAVIPCKRCRIAFTLEDIPNIEREHIHEVALGGPDIPGNCAYSHGACHSTVTNGTPATTAGSSRNRIAKATQPERIRKFQVHKTPLDQVDDLGSDRCRKCGEYSDDCVCVMPVKRSAFGMRR